MLAIHEDLAGQPCSLTHIYLSHHINPSGALVPRTVCDSVPYSACDQIHVWSARQTSHCREQEEARQRAIERGEPDPFPPTLLTNGAVLDSAVGCPSLVKNNSG